MDNALDEACHRVRVATGAALFGIWELRPGGLVSRATDVEGPGITAGRNVPPGRSLFSQALESGEPIHARPGGDGSCSLLGMGTDERSCGSRRVSALGGAGHRGCGGAGPRRRPLAGADRPHARRADPRCQRDRASRAPRPARRGLARSRRTSASAARRRRRRARHAATTRACCSGLTGSRSSSTTRRAACRRRAAPASPTASSTRAPPSRSTASASASLPPRRP